MAFRLISTRSSTGSVRHSPRATGSGLLRVACMPPSCRRLFFAAAPIDLPRRPMESCCLFVAALAVLAVLCWCALAERCTPETDRFQVV